MRRLFGLGWMAGAAAARTIRRWLRPGESAAARVETHAVDTSGPSPSVLVVAPYPVHPPIHGGAVRIFNLVHHLAEELEVSLLLFGGGTDDPGQRAVFEAVCRHVFVQRFPRNGELEDRWGRLPPLAARYASPVVADRIAAIVEAHVIDAVILHSTELAYYAGKTAGASAILDEHDLSFRSHARQRAVGIGRIDALNVLGEGFADWLRRYHFELDACDRADQVHVMSEVDRSALAPHLGDGDRRIRVIPNGVDTTVFRTADGVADRRDVLFVGSFPHLPNLDAVHYLVTEVWPMVRRAAPGARLTVAGARPPEDVTALDGRDGVCVVGEVEDIASLYRVHRVLAVPIRAGSGTRLKILEAMASGLPVVSTTVGAEGIECTPGRDLVVTDRPDEMASAVVDLLGNDDRWREISSCGRQLVEDRYDWRGIAVRLRQALHELSRDHPICRGPVEDPDAGTGSIRASIIIPVRNAGAALERCLDGVKNQVTHHTSEIIAVDLGISEEERTRLRDRGVRVVPGPLHPAGEGAAANAGATAARGRVLVFLSEDSFPADDRWLDRLLAPFDDPQAPAAVQGGVAAQFVPGDPPHDPRFTRENVRWRAGHGGIELSLVNAALRRDVWEGFPFEPRTVLTGPRWQLQAAHNELLVLPCWAAAVVWVRTRDSRSLLRECIDEGRAWRRLGVRYTVGDLVADLRRPLPYLDGQGRPVPVPLDARPGVERKFARIRPLALFAGNWLPR